MFYPLRPFFVTFSQCTGLFIIIYFICGFVCFLHHILYFQHYFLWIYSVDLLSFAVLQSFATIVNYTLISISTSLVCESIILHFSSIHLLHFSFILNNFQYSAQYLYSQIQQLYYTLHRIYHYYHLSTFCIAPLLLYFTHYDTSQLYSIFTTQDLSFNYHFMFQPFIYIFCGTSLLFIHHILQGFHVLYRRC